MIMLSIHNAFLSLALLLTLDQPVSKEALRFRYVMEQGLDASCGMATVATALSLYWRVPILEAELLTGLFTQDDMLDGRADGRVSLATMVVAFESRGVSAKAFRLDWDGLVEILARGYAPVVVHYDRPDPHFALLLGISGELAIVADPARGLETLGRADFEKRYGGVAMALASRALQRDTELLDAVIQVATGRRTLLERTSLEQASLKRTAARVRSGW